MTDKEHKLYFFKKNSTRIFHFKMDFDKLYNSC